MGSQSGKWRSANPRNGYDGHSEVMAHVEYVAWQRAGVYYRDTACPAPHRPDFLQPQPTPAKRTAPVPNRHPRRITAAAGQHLVSVRRVQSHFVALRYPIKNAAGLCTGLTAFASVWKNPSPCVVLFSYTFSSSDKPSYNASIQRWRYNFFPTARFVYRGQAPYTVHT